MIFCGDIAQPFLNASSFSIPLELCSKVWIGNLEGSLIKGTSNRGVFNNLDAIASLCHKIKFSIFNICNNHLLDAADVKTTLDNINDLGVEALGGGQSLDEATQSVLLHDMNGTSVRLIGFGWENIQCVPAGKKTQGVNPFTRKNVLKCVKEAILKSEPVICFMHWNYELEKYPQPYDRQLAMDLIDMGVSAVIGCHAHRVQPIEFYKGRPIVYGLGNFFFKQGHYFDGKLRFPKFCEEEYAFELKEIEDSFVLHHFHYDFEQNNLEFVKSEEISADKNFDGKAEFTGFTAKEYEAWFKTHRVQKKLLPVFMAHETNASYLVKSTWIKIRGKIINFLTKTKIKSANRANRK